MATVAKVLTKVFGSRNERLLKRFHRIVDQINELEPKIQQMSDEQLRARTQQMREEIAAKKIRINDVIPEAMAIIRESMDRHIGIREIFNPEQNFNPDKLDKAQFGDDAYQAYDRVQQHMIATGESWQRVAIPVEI